MRENAADLFPHAVSKDTLSGNPLAVRDFSLAKIRYKPHERPATPTAPDVIVDAEDLPQEIEGLAEDLMICTCLLRILGLECQPIRSLETLKRVSRVQR